MWVGVPARTGLPSAETEESSEGAGLAGKMRSLVWEVAFAESLRCLSGDVEPHHLHQELSGIVRGRGWGAELC